MAGKTKTPDTDEKLGSFILKYRKLILIIAAVAVVAALVVAGAFAISERRKNSALSAIDAAEYAYTDRSEGLEESEITERFNTLNESLSPYLSRRGVVGVRANMLLADAAFQSADYDAASGYYLAAAAADRNAYTFAVNMYNAGVCAEELGNTEDAVNYYDTAANTEGFLLASHAIFNVARISESSGDYDKAAEYYQKAVESYNGDSWANLSQSRLIALRAKGQIE